MKNSKLSGKIETRKVGGCDLKSTAQVRQHFSGSLCGITWVVYLTPFD